MRVFTPQQMREIDRAAFSEVSEDALMRAAGKRVAERAFGFVGEGRIVAFAGKGNNGGDAFAALATLPKNCARTIYAEKSEAPSAARRAAERRARDRGVSVKAFPRDLTEARKALKGCVLVIDGLLGTGSRLPIPAHYVPVITAINESGISVLSIDIPSGTDAESGAAGEPAIRARYTVTLGALKIGLLLEPARSYAGALFLGEIGLPQAALDSQTAQYEALNDTEFVALLPHRAADADKRKAGAPLIVAGSEQFPGAAVLCALGAARAGAGYVTVATPQSAATALRSHLIEQVVVTIGDGSAAEVVDDLLDVAKRCSSIGIGPGLGLDDRTGEIVRGLVQRCELPMVADASALFHFAKNLELLRDKPIVLTPHEGEFARLSGKGTILPGERIARLREFVERTGITTLLKGESTLIYDGKMMHVNTTGTPALATAGTGDVLTGMIATLLSQGLAPVDAARTAAYWHGLAGKLAHRWHPVGVIARDVADALGAAIPHEPPASPLLRIF
ncbi:MAG TPA: NAD(P)H-hydrate dehydratase [Candidatus Rubrimentiphilum sp.]|nr:NAD(P)H-hydrate dehydratase [Candidatus Rubrimentiphilum sp.]